MVLRDRARLVVGSLGLGIALTGLVTFVGQMYSAIQSGRLESVPVSYVLNEPFVRRNVPATLREWFEHTTTILGLDGLVGWLLDEFPLALVLFVVGGLVAWRSLVWEPPASHRR